MYLRAVHAETHIPLLQQFIRDNPLGILTTAIKSSQESFIQSSHIPFILDIPSTDPDTPGVLRGHIARANPQAKALIESLASHQESGQDTLELPDEVLILFNGPHHHYVTPKFYTATKPATGKVVPTWNYSAVQAYGKITVHGNPKSAETGAFLQMQLEDLSRHAETSVMGYEKPWTVGEAPGAYIEVMKKGIIGVEIRIERLQGKFKMSQELAEGDREGVVEGFKGLGSDVGDGIARTVRERAAIKDGGNGH
ncbi:transcriptional regulator [Penicillium chermesinum]|uniref:Transcriptional regulator n=1 Tax=Penicillium chermesinum TaxID=63820 RepID=A0A9W9NV78_9EURO|nr:transcriptional regulator [Penicillium chermesinum]KAJ5225294.1 transcriptional regulator [Penicillium chermesinum]KAJ6140599.1 transcriptional regulator [Penicillium chermesinum]